MPLGLMPGMSYEEKETELDCGQGVFFYSDGLVEAHDPKGEMVGFPRLRALVAEQGEEGSLGDADGASIGIGGTRVPLEANGLSASSALGKSLRYSRERIDLSSLPHTVMTTFPWTCPSPT